MYEVERVIIYSSPSKASEKFLEFLNCKSDFCLEKKINKLIKLFSLFFHIFHKKFNMHFLSQLMPVRFSLDLECGNYIKSHKCCGIYIFWLIEINTQSTL